MPGLEHGPLAKEADGLRIDRWLWFARLFKARERASRFVEEGRVRVARPGRDPERIVKSSHVVRAGDILTFALGGKVRVVRIEALTKRRGPPEEARNLYTDLTGEFAKELT